MNDPAAYRNCPPLLGWLISLETPPAHGKALVQSDLYSIRNIIPGRKLTVTVVLAPISMMEG
jgi:hypothetical protein